MEPLAECPQPLSLVKKNNLLTGQRRGGVCGPWGAPKFFIFCLGNICLTTKGGGIFKGTHAPVPNTQNTIFKRNKSCQTNVSVSCPYVLFNTIKQTNWVDWVEKHAHLGNTSTLQPEENGWALHKDFYTGDQMPPNLCYLLLGNGNPFETSDTCREWFLLWSWWMRVMNNNRSHVYFVIKCNSTMFGEMAPNFHKIWICTKWHWNVVRLLIINDESWSSMIPNVWLIAI